MASSYSYPHARTTSNGHANSGFMTGDGFKDKIGDFLGTSSGQDLPLYKDKPRNVMRRRGFITMLTPRKGRKRYVFGGIALLVIWWFTSSVVTWLRHSEVSWNTRSSMVRTAFITTWDDYAVHAWGKDEYSPISHTSRFMVNTQNTGAGWIIVDGLDTAIMMNCTRQVAQARQWIQTSLDFNKLDGSISVFETTIRVLGGLLSAHYLSTMFPHLAPQLDDDKGKKGEDLYIEKAVDLAERLLGAFDTPTGIPYPYINLSSSKGILPSGEEGSGSTAEAATLQLELKYVAKLTGEPLFWTIAEKVIQALDTERRDGGLLPVNVDPLTGAFDNEYIRLGSRGDSYYEYLVKQYLQTGEKIYKDMWDEALEGIKRHLITWSERSDFTVLAERPNGLNGALSGKMDHLTCFLPGAIAMAVTGGLSVAEAKKAMGSQWGAKQEEDMLLAEELMKTCWAMYVATPTGLAAEITHFKIDNPPRRWNFDHHWKQPRSKVDFDNDKSKDYARIALWKHDLEIKPEFVHNLQRPEAVESMFILYKLTGKNVYREWGWKMFRSFQKWAQVVGSNGKPTGYTSLESVMRVPPKHHDYLVAGTNMASKKGMDLGIDNMEGFWMSETLKYFYLLFSDDISDDWFDLHKVVINTEAHFFPRFDITGHPTFKTGWERKQSSPHPLHESNHD